MLFGAMLAFAPASGATDGSGLQNDSVPEHLYGVYGDQGAERQPQVRQSQ